jgi:hypothetical protein
MVNGCHWFWFSGFILCPLGKTLAARRRSIFLLRIIELVVAHLFFRATFLSNALAL